MGRLILITGGARSGKSSYALARGEEIVGSRCFLATCPVVDEEMAERIRRHRLEREGRGWHSIEEEVDLAGQLGKAGDFGLVLIDCLTLWVNNLLFRAEKSDTVFVEQDMARECADLLTAVGRHPGTIICVTNEVGLGIVPDNPLARHYRDLVGACNRLLATAAEEAILVSCGIPLFLKRGINDTK